MRALSSKVRLPARKSELQEYTVAVPGRRAILRPGLRRGSIRDSAYVADSRTRLERRRPEHHLLHESGLEAEWHTEWHTSRSRLCTLVSARAAGRRDR